MQSNKERYIEICSRDTSIPLFLQPLWLDLVTSDWDVLLLYNGSALSGALPYHTSVLKKTACFINPIWTPYVGIHIFYPSDLKESNKARFEEQVWLQALEQLPSFAKIHIGLFPSQLPAASLRAHGFQVLARQTFVVDLWQDEASLLAACKDSTKRHIQAGQKHLLLQEAPQDALLLWKHYATTLQEKNTTILGKGSLTLQQGTTGQRPSVTTTVIRWTNTGSQSFSVLTGTTPTGSIFWLKNAGWKDKTETEISGNLSLTDLTDEQLDAKIAERMAKLNQIK
jgi:hypothetical protein